MRVFDPSGEIKRISGSKPRQLLETVTGKRVGFLWGGHGATATFWPVLEEVVQEMFRPSEVSKLYKESTFNPAPLPQVEEFASKIDYAIIGVGA